MLLQRIVKPVAIGCVLALALSADASADNWIQKGFKVAGGGLLEFEFPKSWGRKPDAKIVDDITDVQFGPFGPKSKPVFLVHLQAVVAVDPISDADLQEITRIDVENFGKTAFETEIPIKNFEGPNIVGRYFSITDKESKRGEFDYLTMAVIRAGGLLVKCYFLSSDGAPDFGPDAMRMMRSIKYTAPSPEEEKK